MQSLASRAGIRAQVLVRWYRRRCTTLPSDENIDFLAHYVRKSRLALSLSRDPAESSSLSRNPRLERRRVANLPYHFGRSNPRRFPVALGARNAARLYFEEDPVQESSERLE